MKEMMPHTPFSTGLSRSARETERRIRNIFAGPKQDPPRLLVVLTALMVLLCGNLVSCQPGQPVPASSSQSGSGVPQAEDGPHLTRYELPEGARELTLEGRWALTLEDTPNPDDRSQTTDLVCRDLETGAEETWASLYYNPYGVTEEDILLFPFEDLLGYSGVALISRGVEQGSAPVLRLFVHDRGVPTIVAQCEGELYTARVDGFDILLSAYPYGYDGSRGGAVLYWREGDGTVFSRPLRDAVTHFLGLEFEAEVSLSLTVEEGALSARWQTGKAPVQTMDLDLSALLSYARAQAVRTQELQLGYLDGDEPLKLVLEERRLEDEYGWDVFEVEKIDVFRGETRIQTLLPRDWEALADWGLFVQDGLTSYTQLGQPAALDLNGDGVMDFGLLSQANPNRNLPYLYFLWDGEKFVPLAELCAPLETDPENGWLKEWVGDAAWDTFNWYGWEDGELVVMYREVEDWWNSPRDQVMTPDGPRSQKLIHVYRRENGRLIQKEDRIEYYMGG